MSLIFENIFSDEHITQVNNVPLLGIEQGYISYQKNEKFTLLDYDSYLEICGITGEQKMSFFDFYNKIKNQSLEVNSLLDHKDGLKNVNQMQELYKK